MKYFALTPDSHKTTKPLKPIKIEVPKSGWLTTNNIGKVSSITSDTAITLDSNYLGENLSGRYLSYSGSSFHLSSPLIIDSNTAAGFNELMELNSVPFGLHT